MPKRVAVVGVTRTQGGSAISALQDDPSYSLLALTRSVNNEKSKVLLSKGIEVVAADLNDTDSLIKAFKGESIIFAVTGFYEPFYRVGVEKAMGLEYQQGSNIAYAASQTSILEHYIRGTLLDARKLWRRSLRPHFDNKARVDELIKNDRSLPPKTVCRFLCNNPQLPSFNPFLRWKLLSY